MNWRLFHREETISTNLDARAGRVGEVFTADFQTAGRGRLDHRWESERGANLLLSAVLAAAGREAAEVATLPLVAGLAVVRAIEAMLPPSFRPGLKWPNDVLVGGRKVAGILCERVDERVIVGIGVNVGQREFAPELATRAASLAGLGAVATVAAVREAVLAELGCAYARWQAGGFAAIYPQLSEYDFLRGREVSVRQLDGDERPLVGECGGIAADGALLIGGTRVYAGEASVKRV